MFFRAQNKSKFHSRADRVTFFLLSHELQEDYDYFFFLFLILSVFQWKSVVLEASEDEIPGNYQ